MPIVGYFGDLMQQIYDRGGRDFAGPTGSKTITKEENFRSAPQVITLLNAFRNDVTQVPAGEDAPKAGSVRMALVRAEAPEAPRGRYSETQLERASQRLVQAVESWEWEENNIAKKLFLVRRMIARRLGFLPLHDTLKACAPLHAGCQVLVTRNCALQFGYLLRHEHRHRLPSPWDRLVAERASSSSPLSTKEPD